MIKQVIKSGWVKKRRRKFTPEMLKQAQAMAESGEIKLDGLGDFDLSGLMEMEDLARVLDFDKFVKEDLPKISLEGLEVDMDSLEKTLGWNDFLDHLGDWK